MPEIRVPAALTGGSSSEAVTVEGATLREALDDHAAEYGPELRDSVVEDGEIKEYINVYVDGEEVGHLDGLDTALDEGARVRVIPAASGGRAPIGGWGRAPPAGSATRLRGPGGYAGPCRN